MYITINTKRIKSVKGKNIGKIPFFITKNGKPVVSPWTLGIGKSIRLPNLITDCLIKLKLFSNINS